MLATKNDLMAVLVVRNRWWPTLPSLQRWRYLGQRHPDGSSSLGTAVWEVCFPVWPSFRTTVRACRGWLTRKAPSFIVTFYLTSREVTGARSRGSGKERARGPTRTPVVTKIDRSSGVHVRVLRVPGFSSRRPRKLKLPHVAHFSHIIRLICVAHPTRRCRTKPSSNLPPPKSPLSFLRPSRLPG
jgi:hypothetical protein